MRSIAPSAVIASSADGPTTLSDEALCNRIAALRAEMLTVCAWTHQIKFRGEWMTPDIFLRRCFDIPISHGIAPDAAEQLLRDAATEDLPEH